MEGIIDKENERVRRFFALLDNMEKKVERLARDKKVSEKAAFFFCYAARLLSIFIFKISLVFSIITFREVILQK